MIALYVFGIMVAELMGAKTFTVATIGTFTLFASVAIFVMPLIFTSVDVIVEVYGKERARSVVRTGLLIVILQVLTALLFTRIPSSEHFAYGNDAYNLIFGTSIRFGIASIVAFAASEFLDVAVFSKLRKRMRGRSLWFRNNAANFLSQLVDSVVWTTLAFYSFSMSFHGNFKFILGIVVPYYLVRVAMSVLGTPLVYLGVRWFKGPKTETQANNLTELNLEKQA